MAYAIHTRTCAYLLDEGGICRFIMSRQGTIPPHVGECVGAQFVACLDLGTEGGLVPDLRVGAMALLVREVEPGRMILLRTAPILRVEDRLRDDAEPPSCTAPYAGMEGDGIQYGKQRGVVVSYTGPRSFPVEILDEQQAAAGSHSSLPTAPTPTRPRR